MPQEATPGSDTSRRQPLKKCDLVMKGGITSGIVYPPVVMKLHHRYRFCGIGGTSAGAIAAAVTAAAEYGRQVALARGDDAEAPFTRLQEVQKQLCTKGVLRGLFQPEPSTRVVMEVASAAFQSAPAAAKHATDGAALTPAAAPKQGKALRVASKVARVYGTLLRCTPGWALGGAAAGFGVATAMNRVSGTPPSPQSWVGPALAAVAGGFVGGLAGTFQALTVDVTRNGFGICSGRPESAAATVRYCPELDNQANWSGEELDSLVSRIVVEGDPVPGTPVLTDWLCERIDDIAGLKDGDGPLTFGMLEQEPVGVTLRMVTTNVSQNQPCELPFERNCFLFKTEEMLKLFPPKVVKHLLRTSFRHHEVMPPPGYHYLPSRKDLPVAVAMRMSLSFPVLLSAVPLYTVSQDAWKAARLSEALTPEQLRVNWFSDGGISSNFPIHFFDAWLPSRPTFGINLTSVPEQKSTPDLAHVGGSRDFEDGSQKQADVYLPRANEYPAAEVHRLEQLVSFLGAIFSTSQNYRDNMQSTLPSYRERIVQVRLEKDEGGLNLDMPQGVLTRIVEKGEAAGAELVARYDAGGRFEEHRWVRYLVLMNLLEQELARLRSWLREDLSPPEGEAAAGDLPPDKKPLRSRTIAAQRTVSNDEATKFPYPRNEKWSQRADALTVELAEFLESWAPRMKGALEEAEPERIPHFNKDCPKDEPVLRVVPRI